MLDEATSHLDAVNEQAVRRALDLLQSDRTTIVIAHRLSTVRDADLIVVLDAGRVAESGTHASLLAKNGLYARLVSRQLRLGLRPCGILRRMSIRVRRRSVVAAGAVLFAPAIEEDRCSATSPSAPTMSPKPRRFTTASARRWDWTSCRLSRCRRATAAPADALSSGSSRRSTRRRQRVEQRRHRIGLDAADRPSVDAAHKAGTVGRRQG